MAVDVIARALAAKASQGGSGGSGNKVPIDITDEMNKAIKMIENNYGPTVYGKGYTISADSAAFYGSKIAAAGANNVDLFFKDDGVANCHQAFTFEMDKFYLYCFFYNSRQMLSVTIEDGNFLMAQSFIFVGYDSSKERLENISIFFTSEDEAPLYITGTKSKSFHDLASVKTILTYDKNQVIETKDYAFKDNINELLQGIMSISSVGDDLVSRIEHYRNGVTPLYWGEYSRISKEWAFVSSINKSTTSIVETLKIYNGTLDINSWAASSTLKDKVSIVFSNGVPSRLVFNLTEEIVLAANTPLYKYGIVDTTIPKVQTLWGNVALAAAVAPNIITTNFISDSGNWTKSYYCSSELGGDQLGLRFFSKENVTIPAGTRIVIKLS